MKRGRRALPCADLRKAFGQIEVCAGIFRKRRRNVCAGATFAERSVKRVRAAGTPFPRRFAEQSLRARSPLSRGTVFFCGRVDESCGSDSLTVMSDWRAGNTGRCPVLCSLRAYSPQSLCGFSAGNTTGTQRGTPFPRRFAKQSLRARSPLSRGGTVI